MKEKLTKRDQKRMWGDDKPYSQTYLKEEVRILGSSISRIFFVVDAEINPLTFECVLKNKKDFKNDPQVLDLLAHAEYQGDEFGYVVSAGAIPVTEEGSFDAAQARRVVLTDVLLRMHAYTMKTYGITDEKKTSKEKDGRFVWNPEIGRVEQVSDDIWGDEFSVQSPVGVVGDSVRYFLVLIFAEGEPPADKNMDVFGDVLSFASKKMNVGIENIEVFRNHVDLTARIPIDVAPNDFVEFFREKLNKTVKRELIAG